MNADQDLLEAWRAGDRLAGQALFNLHFDAVRRFFQNKAGADTEDLVHTTFERCITAQQRFVGRSTFRAYLFGIARNVLHEHLRRRRPVDFELESIADISPGPSTLVRRRAEERILLEALRRIPVEMQTTLELYYWEDLTGREMAEVLGVGENTVRSRIYRAKAALEEVLEALASSQEVLESTTGNLDRWAAGIRDPDPIS